MAISFLPRRPATFTTLIIAGALTLSLPVIFAVTAGSAPYEALGRTNPGTQIASATALLQSLNTLAVILTVGGLLWRMITQEQHRREPVLSQTQPLARLLPVTASIWLFAALPLGFFRALDTAGVSLGSLSEPGAVGYLISSAYAPGVDLINILSAAAVFLIIQFTRDPLWRPVALWGCAWAVIAPVAVGHVLVGPNHDYASDVAYFQALAQAGGIGLILVTTASVAQGEFPAPRALRRLFSLSFTLVLIMVAPEPLIAWFKLVGTSPSASTTGWLMIASWVSALIMLGALGAGWHQLRAGRANAATVAASLTAASVGAGGWLAATLTMLREPPPQYFVPTSISQVFMGYDVEAPVSAAVWFTHWRPNLFYLILAIGAVAFYLTAVYRLHRRGDHWPLGRTIAWCAGWAGAVFITSSGFGKYSAPDFATHMVVHMTLNMLIPVFLVLGGVITLLLRVAPPSRDGLAGVHSWVTWILNWPPLRILYNPLFVFALFIISYYGLYLSSMFDNLMPFHWGHQLMNTHFLIVGVMFYSLVIGVDPTPRPLPHIGKLGFLIAAMPFHAFFGIILMTSRFTIGGDFYTRLDLPWADLAHSQYVGGGIAWAGGEFPLLIVVIALGLQWAKQDAREARRKDRHLDLGLDPEFDAYNDMLTRLGSRASLTPPLPSDDSSAEGSS